MATAAAAAPRKDIREFTFSWTGQDKAGKTVRGEMRAGGEAQVTATLQLRDVTDGATGPVIASDTFFTERFDSVFDLELPTSFLGLADVLNQVDAIDVSNSSGSDVTALVQRGRTYRIELEVKCDVGAPVFGFAVCLFSGDDASTELDLAPDNPLADVFANDGFRVAPFEVTVDSDPVAEAVSQL